ncbi:hypothetical protein [Streptomyces mobaraensis]|uniref:Uncharacterized protein n=1 Tax=Streptomyces mobaraensis TaxID=35621 RepID=A0A5N5WA11_STRMB|nr:hypothetical protein [Streptomyces mobaraensis]KAB7847266.1 hypothetical protein FRZ00_11175 [Streptomyces mobaraensis]
MQRIHGVSALTRAAVRRLEDERLERDAVAEALSRFAWVFRQPGRYVNASEVWEPGLEVEDARDTLEEAMRHLPRGARHDLGRLVRRIDAEFERRTLPNPGRMSEWTAGRWWWWRIRER